MRSTDNMEETIKKKLSFTASAKMHDRILADVLSTQQKSKKTKSALAWPKTRRTIMKRPITKLAAAAVLIVILSAGIYLFTGTGTSVALGQVKAAIEKIDWLHSINEGSSFESWFAFESKVIIEKQEDGTISYLNFNRNRRYLYDPGTVTIEITKIVPDDVFTAGFEDPFFKRYDGPFEFLADTAKLIQEEGGKFRQSTGEYEGKKVVVWELSYKNSGYYSIDVNSQMVEVPGEEHGDKMVKVFIDAQKHLPLLIKTKFFRKGKLEYETHTRLEYPEVGPKDVYYLGVPKTAKVVDKTQPLKLK